jgi:hypothetical protein
MAKKAPNISTKKKPSVSEIDAEIKQKAEKRSKIYTNSVITAALTIDAIHSESLDIDTVADKLTQSTQRVINGNIRDIEMMLITQAETLNVLFHRTLTQITNIQMINQLQTFMDIALRAQNQCIKTLAVLAELKNPRRATFIKQQNNAINQQVNNATTPENFQNSEKLSNELISEVTHEKMDIGGANKTVTNNTPSTAMAIRYGATNTRG